MTVVFVPNSPLWMVYEEMKGVDMRSCLEDGTGYSPRRWNVRSAAIAPESSLPGILTKERNKERTSQRVYSITVYENIIGILCLVQPRCEEMTDDRNKAKVKGLLTP